MVKCNMSGVRMSLRSDRFQEANIKDGNHELRDRRCQPERSKDLKLRACKTQAKR